MFNFSCKRISKTCSEWHAINIHSNHHHRLHHQDHHCDHQDDNYIAVRDVDTGEYMMNGGFVVSMFQKSIQYDREWWWRWGRFWGGFWDDDYMRIQGWWWLWWWWWMSRCCLNVPEVHTVRPRMILVIIIQGWLWQDIILILKGYNYDDVGKNDSTMLTPICIRYGDTILDYTGSDVEVGDLNLRRFLEYFFKKR